MRSTLAFASGKRARNWRKVGTVLPSDGLSYFDVPEEYGARGSRYTVVNGRTVLVERGTGRIIEIID